MFDEPTWEHHPSNRAGLDLTEDGYLTDDEARLALAGLGLQPPVTAEEVTDATSAAVTPPWSSEQDVLVALEEWAENGDSVLLAEESCLNCDAPNVGTGRCWSCGQEPDHPDRKGRL